MTLREGLMALGGQIPRRRNNMLGGHVRPYDIAKVCHNVNKAYCESIGDYSQPTWEDAPDWQKESALKGVEFHLEADRKPWDGHDSWLKQKEEDGWKWGHVKDPVKKTHPAMVPFVALPESQQTKDYLFKAVVDSFK